MWLWTIKLKKYKEEFVQNQSPQKPVNAMLCVGLWVMIYNVVLLNSPASAYREGSYNNQWGQMAKGPVRLECQGVCKSMYLTIGHNTIYCDVKMWWCASGGKKKKNVQQYFICSTLMCCCNQKQSVAHLHLQDLWQFFTSNCVESVTSLSGW